MCLWSRARQVREANHLTAICESVSQTMWDPQRPTKLKASTASYGTDLPFYMNMMFVSHWKYV
jgi:hypothetical protein